MISVQNSLSADAVRAQIVRLAREASIELNVQDVRSLGESRRHLAPQTRMYVSHLPRQTWEQTIAACRTVRAGGFQPTPHVPVRLFVSSDELDSVLGALSLEADEVLLIAGDYPRAAGPYAETIAVLESGALEKHGFKRVSLAGHPEGHPLAPLAAIRGAELEKARAARESGCDATFLTQFFFDAEPFLSWARQMRAAGVDARIIAGLAGPARVSTLFKYSIRCGVGPSVRALGARPSSVAKLIGERGPEAVIAKLAETRTFDENAFTGIHLFCFGGFLRTCRWLEAVANGRFESSADGFVVA